MGEAGVIASSTSALTLVLSGRQLGAVRRDCFHATRHFGDPQDPLALPVGNPTIVPLMPGDVPATTRSNDDVEATQAARDWWGGPGLGRAGRLGQRWSRYGQQRPFIVD
jgi:hypothetical protein